MFQVVEKKYLELSRKPEFRHGRSIVLKLCFIWNDLLCGNLDWTQERSSISRESNFEFPLQLCHQLKKLNIHPVSRQYKHVLDSEWPAIHFFLFDTSAIFTSACGMSCLLVKN